MISEETNTQMYNEAAYGFTAYLASLSLPFLIAPGRSASNLATIMENHAMSKGITLPTIHRLSHDQSCALYRTKESSPLEVLSPIILRCMTLGEWSEYPIPILDDYTQVGGKPYFMLDRIEKQTQDLLSYKFFILLSMKRSTMREVYVHKIDPELTRWVHEKYNPGSYY